MTDIGKLSWFLGIQFECKNNTIKMNQSKYIEKISKFSMADCKPHSTSYEIDLTKTSDKVNLIDSKPYHEIIGSLICIMVAIRPDICYTVTRLSQDLAKPNFFHLMKTKNVLRIFLSVRVFELLSLSLLFFSQRFSCSILRPSSGVPCLSGHTIDLTWEIIFKV